MQSAAATLRELILIRGPWLLVVRRETSDPSASVRLVTSTTGLTHAGDGAEGAIAVNIDEATVHLA